MKALECDKSGACYIIFPDCPILEFPELNFFWAFAMIFFGRLVAKPLNFQTLDIQDFLIFGLIVIIFSVVLLAIIF